MSSRRVILAGLLPLATSLLCAGPALAATHYGLVGSFGVPGAEAGQFTSPAGVAVSEVGATKGDVYVVDQGNNRVEWFNSTGSKFEGQFTGSGLLANEKGKAAPAALSEPEGIAIDNSSGPSKGDVYVVDKSQGVIDKFSATGEYLFQLTGFATAVVGVAVDTSGDVWVPELEGGVDHA